MSSPKPMPSVNVNRGALSDSPLWWRNPYCWLVLVGPMVVVIAGFLTLWIAVSGADTLVDQNYYQKGLALSKGIDIQSGALQPAPIARNHAATGGTPTAKKPSDK